MSLFIDTGPLLARYLKADQHHTESGKQWARLRGLQCFTSNHVLDEAFTLIARRASYEFAAETAERVFASSLHILRSEQNEEEEALTYFRKYHDQQVSFTDCISFVLMKANEIQQVFTYDSHFRLAGFEIFE